MIFVCAERKGKRITRCIEEKGGRLQKEEGNEAGIILHDFRARYYRVLPMQMKEGSSEFVFVAFLVESPKTFC
jgi:hypothetical protein